MRRYFIPTLCATSLLVGCCVEPVTPGVESAVPPAAVAPPPAPVPAAADQAADTAPAAPSPAPVSGTPAPAVPANVKDAKPAGGAAPVAPVAVGALLAGGAQYAYEDVGLTLTVPAGWTQQLMTGGVIALFSEDYPTKGKRERGALMLVSAYKGTLPTDDKKLAAVLKEGLDPAAIIEAGPIRLTIADKQAAQIVARATDADGAPYRALHTMMQAGGKAVSVKATAFDSLDRRKPLFDAVMESIAFTGAGRGR